MSDNNQRLRRYLATGVIYLAVAASVFGFNVIRSRAARQAAQPAQPDQPTVVSTAPYFSLTTNRTYSPNETARLWAMMAVKSRPLLRKVTPPKWCTKQSRAMTTR